MSRIRIPFASAFTWAIIGLGVGYLLLELNQTREDLRETQHALTQTTVNLRASVEARNDLIANVNRLVVQRDVLIADRNALTADLTEAQTDRHRLGDWVSELSEENRSLMQDKNVLTQEYNHLVIAHEQLEASHEAQQTSYTVLDSSYQDLNLKHTELQLAVGTIEHLESRAGSLRTEIARLEERRRPLILAREGTAGLLCTGSMEPKLTCLDTATWLYDYQPEEIVVGSTISFQSGACGSDKPNDGWTAHRVMDIRVIDGIHYYWPQGDANSEPDGCWISESSVNGYLVEIHKNTRPANATLRNNVNAAKAAYITARESRDAAWDAYAGERDAYFALRQRYGCPSDPSATCYASGLAYDTLVQAYQATNHAYDTYDSAYENYERASDYYDCWYKNAEDSEFPGHIPYMC